MPQTAGPLTDNILREPFWIALVLALAAAATILAALGFQHIGGYQPCALCLMQRWPYYLGVPVALAALAAIGRAPRAVAAALFVAFGAMMLYGLVLAIYHAGVEWRFWEGPASCAAAGAAPESAGSILDSLQSGVRGPSCTDAVWRFLGLSFAGWNALISAPLAALAALGAVRAYRPGHGSSTASQYN